MPGIYAHRNTNVSKVWFVVFIACIAMGVLVWDVFKSLEEITANSIHTRMQIEEFLNNNTNHR